MRCQRVRQGNAKGRENKTPQGGGMAGTWIERERGGEEWRRKERDYDLWLSSALALQEWPSRAA